MEALNAEADRQLSEQRAQADAFATRSGLLTAATALLAGFLANRDLAPFDADNPLLWIIGIAVVMGVLVLSMSRLLLGPSPSELRFTDGSTDDLFQRKVLIIEANSKALLRTEMAFGAQALLTVIGIFFLILTAGGAAA